MKAYPYMHKHPTSGQTTIEDGMDLRDWFAGLAMQAHPHRGSNVYDLMAQKAYKIADLMMEARTRKEVPNE